MGIVQRLQRAFESGVDRLLGRAPFMASLQCERENGLRHYLPLGYLKLRRGQTVEMLAAAQLPVRVIGFVSTGAEDVVVLQLRIDGSPLGFRPSMPVPILDALLQRERSQFGHSFAVRLQRVP